jgi:hypothetical protein
MKQLIKNQDLIDKLYGLSMSFVNKSAYSTLESIFEGDYYYILEFPNRKDYNGKNTNDRTLLSKDSKEYMLMNVFTKNDYQYIDYKSEMVEIVDGYFTYKQYESDSDFAMQKQNYWITEKRDNKLNRILSEI